MTQCYWAPVFSAIFSGASLVLAWLALSNWQRQLRNQTVDRCVSDAKLYEGAVNRYVALRCSKVVSHEEKWKAYDHVWFSLRDLIASYEVVRRYEMQLLTVNIGDECAKGIEMVPLLPPNTTPDANDGQDGERAKQATKAIVASLIAKLGKPKTFLGGGF